MERLDRYVANSKWINLFPEAHVTHLTRIYSDHCPLKLDLVKSYSRNNKVFRVESMWLSHLIFKSLVKHFWVNQDSIIAAIDNITKNVKDWNKNTFGNIFY